LPCSTSRPRTLLPRTRTIRRNSPWTTYVAVRSLTARAGLADTARAASWPAGPVSRHISSGSPTIAASFAIAWRTSAASASSSPRRNSSRVRSAPTASTARRSASSALDDCRVGRGVAPAGGPGHGVHGALRAVHDRRRSSSRASLTDPPHVLTHRAAADRQRGRRFLDGPSFARQPQHRFLALAEV
jgi:hypothetical protein